MLLQAFCYRHSSEHTDLHSSTTIYIIVAAHGAGSGLSLQADTRPFRMHRRNAWALHVDQILVSMHLRLSRRQNVTNTLDHHSRIQGVDHTASWYQWNPLPHYQVQVVKFLVSVLIIENSGFKVMIQVAR